MGNTLDELSPYKGSVRSALVHTPHVSRRVVYRGAPVGVTVDDKFEPVGGDIHLWKQDGQLEIPSHVIFGPQGHGKTFLMMLLLLLSGQKDVGETEVVERNGKWVRQRRRARIRMHSFKRNANKESETAPLIEYWFGCKVITQALLCLNFLARELDLLKNEAYDLLVRTIRLVSKKALNSNQRGVIKDVLDVLWSYKVRDFDVLTELLEEYQQTIMLHQLALQDEQVILRPRYRQLLRDVWPEHEDILYIKTERFGPVEREIDGKPAVVHATIGFEESFDFEKLAELLKGRKFLTNDSVSYSNSLLETLLADTRDLVQTMRTFREGEFYSLFSGDPAEFVKLITQRAVSIDLKSLSDDARTLTEMIVAGIDLAATTLGADGKPRHPERIPDAVGYDEFYGTAENDEAMNVNYREQKTQRESGRETIFAIMKPSDLDAVSSAGSSAARKAGNKLADIGAVWLGRVPKSEHQRIRNLYEPPEHVIRSLPTLPKGHFWLKTPKEPWTEVAVIGTPEELISFFTEAAQANRLAQYLNLGEIGDYREYVHDYIKVLEELTEADDKKAGDAGHEVNHEPAMV